MLLDPRSSEGKAMAFQKACSSFHFKTYFTKSQVSQVGFELMPHCNQPIQSMQDLCLNPPEQQFVPGGAQGLGPESRQDACRNGVLRKPSPGLPDQQRWLGTLPGAHSGVGVKEYAAWTSNLAGKIAS
eukprot:1157920-Pelagomonas_calceolata.AAC.2